MGYFEESLQNFTRDFAYAGAIRHLRDHGYTAEQMKKEFHYPISIESIEKIIADYEKEKGFEQKQNESGNTKEM